MKKKRKQGGAPSDVGSPATPFRLEGSMRLVGDEADLEAELEALRREQAELAEAKFRDL